MIIEKFHIDLFSGQATAGLNHSSDLGMAQSDGFVNKAYELNRNVKIEKMKPGNSGIRLKSDIFEASENGKQ